jgi:NADH:ubiquinone reductase (H+-translocating)
MYTPAARRPSHEPLQSAHDRRARGGTLIIGGGFAGSQVARRLGRAGATVINPANYMLHTPLLPEAAGGSIEPRHAVVPLRAMCPHADVVLGSVVEVDHERRTAEVQSEAGWISIGYRDLVVALGSVSRMPLVPGLHQHALTLKDLADAIRLRNHVLRQIELADAAPADAARRLTFVFAGAGFAGVETLAEMQELATDALRRHPRLSGVRPRWLLVDSAPRILAQMPERLARSATRTLTRRGVEIVTGTRLERVDPEAATLSDGHRIETATVVWTAGITPNPLAAQLGLPHDEHGRIVVGDALRVPGVPHVWALGDCAAVPNAATGAATDPATCQHALRQAARLAANLRGTSHPYAYRARGQLATLGSRHGVALAAGIPVTGLPGWLLARGYHLMALPFASRRARVIADWMAAACFRRDTAELAVVPR